MEGSETGGSGSGTGQQQFLVEHNNRLYVTSVLEEADPSDPRFQDMLRGGDAGRAGPLAEMSFKSMGGETATFGNINDAAAGGNVNEASNFGNINDAAAGGNINEANNFGNINDDKT